jgi:hypothetical protein
LDKCFTGRPLLLRLLLEHSNRNQHSFWKCELAWMDNRLSTIKNWCAHCAPIQNSDLLTLPQLTYSRDRGLIDLVLGKHPTFAARWKKRRIVEVHNTTYIPQAVSGNAHAYMSDQHTSIFFSESAGTTSSEIFSLGVQGVRFENTDDFDARNTKARRTKLLSGSINYSDDKIFFKGSAMFIRTHHSCNLIWTNMQKTENNIELLFSRISKIF